MKNDKKDESLSLAQFAPHASFKTNIEALVVQTLRNAITQGAFYPGQELNEVGIAVDLEISRMPVRQAMSILETEGLVTRVPRKGVFVTSLDSHDLEEIYTTRVALEEVAIRAAIPQYTKEDFEKIERNLETPQEKISTYSSFLVIDKAFHALLYAPSGWKRVTKYIQELRNNTAMYRILKSPLPVEKLNLSLSDHRNIFDACKKRDADTAAKLLREHTLKTIPSIAEITIPNKT